MFNDLAKLFPNKCQLLYAPLVADSALVLLDAGVVVHVVPVGDVMIP